MSIKIETIKYLDFGILYIYAAKREEKAVESVHSVNINENNKQQNIRM